MAKKGRRNRPHKPKPKLQHHAQKHKTKKHDPPADEWAQLREMGLYCKEISGDGNCLFRSLSDQFYGNTRQHSKVRKEVCEYLEANYDHFQYFVEDDKTFDYHLSRMKKDGTYGGNMELVGFAQLYGVDIKIYQPGTIYVIEGNRSDNDGSTKEVKTRKTLHIAYHNWEHYSSVRNIKGPHEGDPEIISKTTNATSDSIEKEIMNATGEKDLTKIRKMMIRLQFDHNEVINELIESSQKTSDGLISADEIINESIESPRKISMKGDESDSKKVVDEVINEPIESSQKSSINVSNLKKVSEEDTNLQEKNLPAESPSQKINNLPGVSSLNSLQNKTTTQSEISSKKRSQKALNVDINDPNQFLSKKEKRKLRKQNNNRNRIATKHKEQNSNYKNSSKDIAIMI